MHLKANLGSTTLRTKVAFAAQVMCFSAMSLGGGQALSQGSVTPTAVVSSAAASPDASVGGAALAPAVAPAQPVVAGSSSAAPQLQPTMTTQEGLALARAKACLGCHQVDSKRVGPAFLAIAGRRADQEGAVSYLSHVIRKGGRGQWGAVPMPGQPVSEQDAQRLAQWIISLRK